MYVCMVCMYVISQQRDSNSRPPVYETGAITTMLCWQFDMHINITQHTHTHKKKKSHSALTVPEWSPTSVLGKPNDA